MQRLQIPLQAIIWSETDIAVDHSLDQGDNVPEITSSTALALNLSLGTQSYVHCGS